MEIPASLRSWFAVDFAVNLACAVPLLLFPEAVLPRFGWTTVDPVTSRLVAAAMLALGVQSLRVRSAGATEFRTLLGVKVVWSGTAIVGLTLAIARGAPSLAFVLLAAFLAFFGIWSHSAIRLRQQAEAEVRGTFAETTEDGGLTDDLGPGEDPPPAPP